MQINTPLYLCLIKTWRAVLALATHHPLISIKLNISMTSSESYWNKKGKTFELWVDEITESTQQRAINMMGLSSTVRLTFEGAILFEENQQEIPFRGNGAVDRKKTVILIRRTIHALTFHRRVLALSAVIGDKWKSMSTIKEHSGLLEKVDSNFFGSGFRKNVVETAKAIKESKEVYRYHQMDIKQPLRKGPLKGGEGCEQPSSRKDMMRI